MQPHAVPRGKGSWNVVTNGVHLLLVQGIKSRTLYGSRDAILCAGREDVGRYRWSTTPPPIISRPHTHIHTQSDAGCRIRTESLPARGMFEVRASSEGTQCSNGCKIGAWCAQGRCSRAERVCKGPTWTFMSALANVEEETVEDFHWKRDDQQRFNHDPI